MLCALIYMQIDGNLPLACRAWLGRIKWDLSAGSFLAHWGETNLLQLSPAAFNWSVITEHFSMCWMNLTVPIWRQVVGWFTARKRAVLNDYIKQTRSLKPAIGGGPFIQLSGRFLIGVTLVTV